MILQRSPVCSASESTDVPGRLQCDLFQSEGKVNRGLHPSPCPEPVDAREPASLCVFVRPTSPPDEDPDRAVQPSVVYTVFQRSRILLYYYTIGSVHSNVELFPVHVYIVFDVEYNCILCATKRQLSSIDSVTVSN